MTTLHIIHRSNYQTDYHALISDGDAVILIENGVYTATTVAGTSPCYALLPDCEARGVQLPDAVEGVGYDRFVALCTEYDKVVTW